MKKLITTFLVAGTFLLWTEGWSQEDPAGTKKDISTLKETARSKLRSLGGERSAEVGEDPLAMPETGTQMPEGTTPRRYSSVGKRDPFRPFVLELRPRARRRENLSPLERVEVSQLKLVGIIWDIPEPRAMVEDSAGLGYVIKIGTPIGRNDGTVKVIAPKEVVVEENFFDFYGAKKSREVKLKLVSE